MNLCCNCKHHFGWIFDRCRIAPPPRVEINKVTGERWLRGNDSCGYARLWGHCDTEGIHFEPKESK